MAYPPQTLLESASNMIAERLATAGRLSDQEYIDLAVKYAVVADWWAPYIPAIKTACDQFVAIPTDPVVLRVLHEAEAKGKFAGRVEN